MATQIPKPSAKRQRRAERAEKDDAEALMERGFMNPSTSSVLVQFQSGQDNSFLGTTLSMPATAGQREMGALVNTLRREMRKVQKEQVNAHDMDDNASDDDDEDVPYTFHVAVAPKDGSQEPTRIHIGSTLQEDLLNTAVAKKLGISEEDSLTVVYEPQAVFRVRAVHRCSSTLSGSLGGAHSHADSRACVADLVLCFQPIRKPARDGRGRQDLPHLGHGFGDAATHALGTRWVGAVRGVGGP